MSSAKAIPINGFRREGNDRVSQVRSEPVSGATTDRGWQMPWFPDFAGAVELARSQSRAAGQADPIAQFFKALNQGDSAALESVWPGEVVICDPRAGVVRGHKQLRQFVGENQSWLAGARIDTIASTVTPGRAVLEFLAHLKFEGKDRDWPVAVVAESPDDRSVFFRTYCSQWPLFGRNFGRGPILDAGADQPGDVVGQYMAAFGAGDSDALVGLFTADGYFREPSGSKYTYRGRAELQAFFNMAFSQGGGILLQPCAVTDDGVHCAVEYNCVSWGSHDLPPQAGIGIYERGPDGLLAAARVYDDVAPPLQGA